MNVAAYNISERTAVAASASTPAPVAADFCAAVDSKLATSSALVCSATTPVVIAAQIFLPTSAIACPLAAATTASNATMSNKTGISLSSNTVAAAQSAVTIKNSLIVLNSSVAPKTAEIAAPIPVVIQSAVIQAYVSASPAEPPAGKVMTVRSQIAKVSDRSRSNDNLSLFPLAPLASVTMLADVTISPAIILAVDTGGGTGKPGIASAAPTTASVDQTNVICHTTSLADVPAATAITMIGTAVIASAKAFAVQGREPRYTSNDVPVEPASIDDLLPVRPPLGAGQIGNEQFVPIIAGLHLGSVSSLGTVLPATHLPSTPTPMVSGHLGEIGRQVGVEIARRVSAGGDELTVRLDPAEMGRIEIKISFDDRGSLRAVVAADSPVSLDLLRRDSGDLNRALTDAGIRADAQSFRFDSRGGGEQPSQRQSTAPVRRYSEPAADFEDIVYRPVRTRGQIDLLA